MPYDEQPQPPVSTGEIPYLILEDSPEEAVIKGPDLKLRFDKSEGMLSSFSHLGVELIKEGPRLNLWRAPTDNDVPNFAKQWRALGLDRLEESIMNMDITQSSAQIVKIVVDSQLRPLGSNGFSCVMSYTVHGSGDIVIGCTVDPEAEMPHLPRLGLQLTMPGGFENFTWYGRGPYENYVDRREGTMVGLYSCSVDDLHIPYIKPQENGKWTGVRWASLTNAEGVGLLVIGEPHLELSAHHYTIKDLESAKHDHELAWRDDISLYRDHMQTGLGGGSCGPDTLPQYRVFGERTSFTVKLRSLPVQ